MTWKKKDYNLYPDVILSDCTISRMQIKDNNLILSFSEYGFIKKEEDGNYYRTDGAEIVVENFDREGLIIKEKRVHRLSENLYFDSMFDVPFEVLLNNVNSGKWGFEIVREFYAVKRGIFVCQVEEEETFWLYLKLRYSNLIYSWNNIRHDWLVN